MKPRVFVILLLYTREHLNSSLLYLNKLIRNIVPGLERHDVIVDNAWCGDIEWSLSSESKIIAGDNQLREFSGWDVGIRDLVSNYRPRDNEFVFLVNDTFHRNYGAKYLRRFNARSVKRELKAGSLVGWVDGYPASVQLLDFSFRQWIRTSLVIGSYGSLRKLFPFAPQVTDLDLFSDDIKVFFSDSAPLSENYRQYLKTWLFDDKNDGVFKEAWHSKRALTDENFSFFRSKVNAILCEHLLSARAQRLGIPIFDVRTQKRMEGEIE